MASTKDGLGKISSIRAPRKRDPTRVRKDSKGTSARDKKEGGKKGGLNPGRGKGGQVRELTCLPIKRKGGAKLPTIRGSQKKGEMKWKLSPQRTYKKEWS